MFEYRDDLITSAQSDIECGIDVSGELYASKDALINSESYLGKINVDSFFATLKI